MSIRVCTCCRFPTVVDPVKHPSDMMDQIALPDNTPVDRDGDIQPEVLEVRGLMWSPPKLTWLDKNGDRIHGLLDLSQPAE